MVGTGLIGGSIGLALRARGWHVSGVDADSSTAKRALELGALDAVGADPSAAVTFVAIPASTVAGAVRAVLDEPGRHPAGVVSDVAGVKAPVVGAADHPRFVGGHPMAGSEQEGVEGADPALFAGATWVLTPTARTDADAYTGLRSVITSLGAEVVALSPERHDDLVATVSHVPHLVAATLMGLAADGADEHTAMLRLAAGGFRDMTRVAAGHPGIWPDICSQNAEAIVAALDRLASALGSLRQVVATDDRPALMELLERARAARRSLPIGMARPEDLCELRVPVADRPGVLAEVTTLAGELGVNVADMEIAHSVEGDRGVLSLVVGAPAAERLAGALRARGYRLSLQGLT